MNDPGTKVWHDVTMTGIEGVHSALYSWKREGKEGKRKPPKWLHSRKLWKHFPKEVLSAQSKWATQRKPSLHIPSTPALVPSSLPFQKQRRTLKGSGNVAWEYTGNVLISWFCRSYDHSNRETWEITAILPRFNERERRRNERTTNEGRKKDSLTLPLSRFLSSLLSFSFGMRWMWCTRTLGARTPPYNQCVWS